MFLLSIYLWGPGMPVKGRRQLVGICSLWGPTGHWVKVVMSSPAVLGTELRILR